MRCKRHRSRWNPAESRERRRAAVWIGRGERWPAEWLLADSAVYRQCAARSSNKKGLLRRMRRTSNEGASSWAACGALPKATGAMSKATGTLPAATSCQDQLLARGAHRCSPAEATGERHEGLRHQPAWPFGVSLQRVAEARLLRL